MREGRRAGPLNEGYWLGGATREPSGGMETFYILIGGYTVHTFVKRHEVCF